MSKAKTGPSASELPPRAAPRPEALIYIGPSRVGKALLPQATVYSGGVLPPQIKALTSRSADLAALFVPVSRAGAAKAELRDPGSKLAKAYAAVAKMEV